LSLLRALAVAEELRRASFPEDAITVVGNGSKLRIVRDDPRNPQNYVVEFEPSVRYD
jgi:outer membrane protein OmpA-like peptidoglycan-associated protein